MERGPADRGAPAALSRGPMTTRPGETWWDPISAAHHPVREAERAAFKAYKASFEEAL